MNFMQLFSGPMWFGMLVPVMLVSILLSFPSFRRRVIWWEIAIPTVVTFVVIIVCQAVAVSSAVRDTEYWGELGQKIIHEEPFSYDSECPETYACGET